MTRKNLFGSPIGAGGEVLGCSACPLDKSGARKVIGHERIRGRRAMLWSQQPGAEDSRRGLELTGDAGDLLWAALARHGLTRADFDTQNVVRCRVADGGVDRPPTAREVSCCSVHSDRALELNRGRASVHLVLGEVAGSALLGPAFRKDAPVVWHAPWDAYAVLAPHPKFIITQGAERAAWSWERWNTQLRAARAVMDNPGRFGHVLAQDNRAVRTPAEFDEMERDIRAESGAGRRVSLDVEDDSWGERAGTRMLLAGFGTGRYKVKGDWRSWEGRNWSVVLDHPESGHTARSLAAMKARVAALVADATVRKSLQNGASDTRKCRDMLGARLAGYDYDTQYGTYLRYSFLRSCTLENLTALFLPEFADYKDAVAPWDGDYSKAPLGMLLLRNQGDVAATKRLEEMFSPDVRQSLVRVYINAGMTLSAMEGRGPTLDWENWRRAREAVPGLVKRLDRDLQRMSGDDGFRCTDRQVAWLLYDRLRMPVREDVGRKTGEAVLVELEAETNHPVFRIILARRGLAKIDSASLKAYERSARKYNDELRTRWALTGAVTGRLRSSGEGIGGVNLQNLNNNKLLQLMLVSDKEWRRAKTEALKRLLDLDVYLTADGSQIEIRALAELSNDPVMIKLLREAAADRKNKQKDFHALNGHMLTGRPVEQIATDKGVRRSVKNLIFGIIFGKARSGMYDYVVQKIREFEGQKADLTGITRSSVDKLYVKFFGVYKGVARWIKAIRETGERTGRVESLFGFVRHIRTDDDDRKTFSGNQCINSPVQSSAHQFLLIALALLHLKPRTYSLLQRCIMEVHDALYFKVKLRHLAEAHGQLMHLFEVGAVEYAEREFKIKLRVPLLAEAEAGFCMGSLVGYEGEELEVFLKAWRAKQTEVESKSWEDLMPAGSV